MRFRHKVGAKEKDTLNHVNTIRLLRFEGTDHENSTKYEIDYERMGVGCDVTRAAFNRC